MGEDEYKIELKTNGDVIVNYDKFINKVVTSNVLKAFVVNNGQGDTGDLRIVVLIKENGTLEALKMDDLLYNNEIKIINDFNNIKNIVNVYSESQVTNEYEPPAYKVFAKNIDGQIYDISAYL